MNDITFSEMDKICGEIAAKRRDCDALAQQVKEANRELEALEYKLMDHLEAANRTSYENSLGKFSISHRTSVRVPKGEDREKFFDYLKDRGLFESMITVNSQTLTGWYKEEEARAVEEGRLLDFSVPGLDGITVTPTLSFRKAAN